MAAKTDTWCLAELFHSLASCLSRCCAVVFKLGLSLWRSPQTLIDHHHLGGAIVDIARLSLSTGVMKDFNARTEVE